MNSDGERLIRLETQMDNVETKLQDQEQTNLHLSKLATFVELQTGYNAKQERHNEKIVNVMNGIEINLSSLNRDVKDVKTEVSHVNTRVDTLEKEELIALKEANKLRNDNKWKIITAVVGSVLSFVIVGLLTYLWQIK